ncbi:MAG: CBS domain-containing protein [Candidatus Rokubacteria bacterium]|nr:CBS domain-containing protein [Candidatus Rokubacteria bacterium]
MSEPRVAECQYEPVPTCGPEASLEEVAAILRTGDVDVVVVVDGGAAVGVISKTDLVNAAFVEPYLRFWRGMAARHLMSAPAISVRPDTPLAAALELLRSRRIHRLVVAEPAPGGERPIGILALAEMVRVLGFAAAEGRLETRA